MSDEPLVTAGIVSKKLNVPRYVLYRLVEQKKLVAHERQRPSWDFSNRRYYLFRLSEVQAALAALREARKGDG